MTHPTQKAWRALAPILKLSSTLFPLSLALALLLPVKRPTRTALAADVVIDVFAGYSSAGSTILGVLLSPHVDGDDASTGSRSSCGPPVAPVWLSH